MPVSDRWHWNENGGGDDIIAEEYFAIQNGGFVASAFFFFALTSAPTLASMTLHTVGNSWSGESGKDNYRSVNANDVHYRIFRPTTAS